MAYIRFEKTNKYFGKNHVLKDIDLEIEKGQLVTLLGPSGCGKSTLLRCLAGLEEVSGGKIWLDDEEITHVAPRKRGIGMVFQQYSLFPNMNVRENVAYGLKLKKLPKEEIRKKVENMLEIVGLSDKIDQYPSQLSGGQQQRVALARAMVLEPKVLLLDEPLSAIDALLRKNLQVEIRGIQQRLGITTIFVTHDQEEAMVMSDMIHLFHDGEIEQSGTPEQIYTRPATKFAATFIGNYNILTAEELNRAFGSDLAAGEVAIRPETISLGREAVRDERTISAKGTVKSFISHGNLIRYGVEIGEIRLNADAVFMNGMEFGVNDEVYAAIPVESIVRI